MDPYVRLPPEMFLMIMSALRVMDQEAESYFLSCALVSRAWLAVAREFLFGFLNVDLCHERCNPTNFVPFLQANPDLARRVGQLQLVATDDPDATRNLSIQTIAEILDLLPNLNRFYLRGVCTDDYEVLPEGFFASRRPFNLKELQIDSLRPTQSDTYPQWGFETRSIPSHLTNVLGLFGQVDELEFNRAISYGDDADDDEGSSSDMYRDVQEGCPLLPHLRVRALRFGGAALRYKPYIFDILAKATKIKVVSLRIDEGSHIAQEALGRFLLAVNKGLKTLMIDGATLWGCETEDMRVMMLDTCKRLASGAFVFILDSIPWHYENDIDAFRYMLEALPLLPKNIQRITFLWDVQYRTPKEVIEDFQEPDWETLLQGLDQYTELRRIRFAIRTPRSTGSKGFVSAVTEVLQEKIPGLFLVKEREILINCTPKPEYEAGPESPADSHTVDATTTEVPQ